MPQALPSTVCEVIRQLLPRLYEPGQHIISSEDGLRQKFHTIVKLCALIPEPLLPWLDDDMPRFVLSEAYISSTLSTWEASSRPQDYNLPLIDGMHPAAVMIEILGQYPDQLRRHDHKLFPFIADEPLRVSIADDLYAAESALKEREYKSATVMAGSAIEALLAWYIDQLRNNAPEKYEIAVTKYGKLPKDFDRWDLGHMIGIAKQFNDIDSDSMKNIETAKEYRNLIHPLAAVRRKAKCDRGTAMTNIGTVHNAIRCLERGVKFMSLAQPS